MNASRTVLASISVVNRLEIETDGTPSKMTTWIQFRVRLDISWLGRRLRALRCYAHVDHVLRKEQRRLEGQALQHADRTQCLEQGGDETDDPIDERAPVPGRACTVLSDRLLTEVGEAHRSPADWSRCIGSHEMETLNEPRSEYVRDELAKRPQGGRPNGHRVDRQLRLGSSAFRSRGKQI